MTEQTNGIPIDLGDTPALGITVALTNDAKTQIGFTYAAQVHRPGQPSWQNLTAAQRDRYFGQILDDVLEKPEMLKAVGYSLIEMLKVDTLEKANAICEGIIEGIEQKVEGV